MIKDLSFEQEKKLANSLYYGGGVAKKYLGGGETDIPLTPEQIALSRPLQCFFLFLPQRLECKFLV